LTPRTSQNLPLEIGGAPIRIGDRCALGSQMRPHIVWFGENVMSLAESLEHIQTADRVLVVGTSLVVYPAAGLLRYAREDARKVIVDVQIPDGASGFQSLQGSADEMLPALVFDWLNERQP
jgi:NAD-dependent deacetylase